MDWSWAVDGVTNETPRTMGPECEAYMTDRRRWIEAVLFCILFTCIIKWATKRMEPIHIPDAKELEKPHSTTRLMLLIFMTLIFGIEMGFKLANRSVIFVLNPCHIQTLVQIYLLAAKPNKLTITLFRIQMNNLNGPVLAFVFPEVDCRTLPFEQATYWIQHAMLYIIPVYIIRTGAYQVEDIKDFNWAIIGVETQLIYHFGVLNFFSIRTGINLNHMLCAAESDPFQGDNYRIAAVIHESILCPILNKLTVLIFSTPKSIQYNVMTRRNMQQTKKQSHQQQQQYSKLTATTTTTLHKKQQQPAISETTYYPDDRRTETTKLINRKSNPADYQQHDHSPQHQLHQQQYQQQQEQHEKKDAVFKGDYILEPDDMDMEVIEDPTATSATSASMNAEYTMPTTKID
ncbi:transmembrane protein 164 [Calliphora vicina]|uniref:transmembrane protein 164 n=1 Tax=Calliphora vicina TaxID=7373 RepID=UPI00325B71CC